MKISLALGTRQPLSRQTAWGCLTTNLLTPGFGSLLAGRRSGYPQVALALGGMGLTLVFGLRFILWNVHNWDQLHDPGADSVEALTSMWLAGRWAFLGIALFALALLWALATSLAILRDAKKTAPPSVPPRLSR
jgi:hypothetical protein